MAVGASSGVLVTSSGHLEFYQVAVPTITDCGSNPSVVGTDSAGKITVGSGGTAGICNLSFRNSWTNPPACFCGNESQVLLVRSSSTASVMTCSVAVTFAASDILPYHCVGRR